MNGKRVTNLICLKRNGEELGFFLTKGFENLGKFPPLSNSRNFGMEFLNEIMLSKLMKCCLNKGGTWPRCSAGSWYQQSLSAAKLLEKSLFLFHSYKTEITAPTWGQKRVWDRERRRL